MNTSRFDKPHVVLIAAVLLLGTLAGFAARVSTRAMERVIIAKTTDLTGSRVPEARWEFLRDGMVLGRLSSKDGMIYLLNLRLFGGDHRYALTLEEDGLPKTFINLGTGPVSPHANRIALVMRAYFGEELQDTTALDGIIAHTIMANFQRIAINERTRKETHDGN